MGWHAFGPASFGLGEGLTSQDVLVTSCSSDSLWRAGRLQADFGRQLDGVSSDMLRLASGLSERCFKKLCGLVGRVSEDAWLSTLASPEYVQELQRWDKTVATTWIS